MKQKAISLFITLIALSFNATQAATGRMRMPFKNNAQDRAQAMREKLQAKRVKPEKAGEKENQNQHANNQASNEYSFEKQLFWKHNKNLLELMNAIYNFTQNNQLPEAQKIQNLEKLIKKSPDTINKKTLDGETPLMLAANHGYTNICSLLIEKKADLEAIRTNDHYTALIIALADGNRQTADLLLELKANPNASMKTGYTPLFSVIERNEHFMVDRLLEVKANPNDKATKFGFFPLFYAARIKNYSIIKSLLDAKAHVNDSTEEGTSALLAAIKKYKLPQNIQIDTSELSEPHEIVKLLLESKAHIDKEQNQECLTALFQAVEEQDHQSMKLLLDAKANTEKTLKKFKKTPLFVTPFQDDATAAKILFEASANFHQISGFISPLTLAVFLGSPETTELFMSKIPSNPTNQWMNEIENLLKRALSGFHDFYGAKTKTRDNQSEESFMKVFQLILDFYKKHKINIETILHGDNNDNENDEFSFSLFEIACSSEYGPLIRLLESASQASEEVEAVNEVFVAPDLSANLATLIDARQMPAEDEKELDLLPLDVKNRSLASPFAGNVGPSPFEADAGPDEDNLQDDSQFGQGPESELRDDEQKSPEPVVSPQPIATPSVTPAPAEERIIFFNKQIQKRFDKLEGKTQKELLSKLNAIIDQEAGKKSSKKLKGLAKIDHLRAGHYRVDYEINGDSQIKVLAAYHRSDLTTSIKKMKSMLSHETTSATNEEKN